MLTNVIAGAEGPLHGIMRPHFTMRPTPRRPAKPRSPVAISAALVLACASLSFGADRFRFAVVADPQLGMVELERDTQNFASVAAAISALPEATRPRFVLVAGDLVNTAGDHEQLRRFQEVRARFTVPVWVVPGNHDLAADGRKLVPDLADAFRRDVAPDRFVRTEGGCVFIGLNSQLWTLETTAREQLAWLESSSARRERGPFSSCSTTRSTSSPSTSATRTRTRPRRGGPECWPSWSAGECARSSPGTSTATGPAGGDRSRS